MTESDTQTPIEGVEQTEKFKRVEEHASQHYGWKKISQLSHLAIELQKVGDREWASQILDKAIRSIHWITDVRVSIFMATSKVDGDDGIKDLCNILQAKDVLKHISDYVLIVRMIHRTNMPDTSQHLFDQAKKQITATPGELNDMGVLHARRGEKQTARWIFQLSEFKVGASEETAHLEEEHTAIARNYETLANNIAQNLGDTDWAKNIYHKALTNSKDPSCHNRIAQSVCRHIDEPAVIENFCNRIIELVDDPSMVKAVARKMYDCTRKTNEAELD